MIFYAGSRPGGTHDPLMLADDYKINGQTAWGLRRKRGEIRMLLASGVLDADARPAHGT